MTSQLETLPASRQAEECVIGSILLDHESILRICDRLEPADFWHTETRAVYQAALNVLKRGEPVDFIALDAELERLDYRGRSPLKCIEATPTAYFIEQYASEVKRLAVCRRGIALASEMANEFYSKPADPNQTIAEVGARMLGLTSSNSRRNPDPQDILLRFRAQDNSAGIKVSSHTFNYYTGGLQPGELWVIGGFSSTGKTAFALQLLRDVLKAGKRAVYFSLEMSQEQLMLRLLAGLSGVSMRTIRYREETPDELAAVHDAEQFLAECASRCWIYDDVYSPEQTMYVARKHHLQAGGLDVVFVDYLQNLLGNREEHELLSNAANQYLQLAKTLGCSVVALSQISNAEAKDSFGNNEAYSFKGSGGIRDSADKAIMLTRERSKEVNNPAIADLFVHVKKNRTFGLVGSIRMCFEFATGRIWEPIREH